MPRSPEEVLTEDAKAYGRQAFAQFHEAECPGGVEHEQRGTAAEFCAACIRGALTRAFAEGARWMIIHREEP